MRYECEEAGFEGAYIEFSEKAWTRGELRDIRTLSESDEWFAILCAKVTGINLPAKDGALTEAHDLTPAALDRLDLVLYNWLVTVVVKAAIEVAELGNAVWRRQFPTVVATEPSQTK
jgi:hypothetical protein